MSRGSEIGTKSISDNVLHSVASFLPVLEKVIFISAISVHDGNQTVREIIFGDNRNNVEEIDFAEIKEQFASRLSDNDLSSIQLSIDAVNNIKRLKLTNCYSIKGSGFEPLHGSTVLELLDLSLVKIHESPRLEEELKICAGAVIPILDSIIERGDDPALKLIQFPAR